MNGQSAKAPLHFWIVGVIAVLWNAIGAFDYSATQLRLEAYMSAFTPEQLEYFYSFPTWAVAAWAFGVWGALLGSIALLLRKAWAVWAFGISIAGMVLTTIQNFVLTDGAALMGPGAVAFSAVIWAVALFLFFYARAMAKRGVLT
jgi:flagellar motor component MotA